VQRDGKDVELLTSDGAARTKDSRAFTVAMLATELLTDVFGRTTHERYLGFYGFGDDLALGRIDGRTIPDLLKVPASRRRFRVVEVQVRRRDGGAKTFALNDLFPSPDDATWEGVPIDRRLDAQARIVRVSLPVGEG
jgi:hypothetical protein